jgi:hypothetical protein
MQALFRQLAWLKKQLDDPGRGVHDEVARALKRIQGSR